MDFHERKRERRVTPGKFLFYRYWLV